MAKNIWSKEETIVAFNVYCKVPFKSSSKTNPTIIKYAKILGRTPSALNMKIGNLGRLDPELKKQGIVGLKNGSKMEEIVWNEFHGNWDKLAFESEVLIAKFQGKNLEEIHGSGFDNKIGIDKKVITKQRINQSFFRSTILSSYNSKCCISNLSIPTFLVASHIKPWSIDIKNRLNPRNGLCLNSIHDKAFDKGFLTVTPDYTVKISSQIYDLKYDKSLDDFFIKFDKRKIRLPDKFYPDKELLDYHYREVFIN